ncbi:MAG TPA: GNAT family N-acetyltransferase [Steroidobacteraceae bacterium]|nr:GNAT family N-acetyltransferase [Steroidobacteraceae bacterium]
MQALDRPAWASLTTFHASLSVGNASARRYLSDVNMFASTCDETLAHLSALAELVRPGEQVIVLQVPQIVVPPGFSMLKRASGVQMLASRRAHFAGATEDIVELTDLDAPEMLALARLTEPGPFLPRTHRMGKFIGIRRDGRLAAMAGERFRFPGYTEVSGVCTHPDFRGRGYARALSSAVAASIEARGERAFLHAWKTNRPAISLYESLGFQLCAEVDVAVLERAADDPRNP